MVRLCSDANVRAVLDLADLIEVVEGGEFPASEHSHEEEELDGLSEAPARF